MKVNGYVNFQGNCREAVLFYATIFGVAAPKFMEFRDMPPNPSFIVSDEMKKLILHTEISVGESTLMFSDVPPDMPVTVGNNITLCITGNKMDLLKKWYNALAVGGEIIMPLGETFWSKCYGFLTDKFGIGWQLNYSEQ